jgi:hypothetical protein
VDVDVIFDGDGDVNCWSGRSGSRFTPPSPSEITSTTPPDESSHLLI